MLTENEARDLLHLAGATIEVAPAEPMVLAARRPPRWPALAAAAAVVAIVATSVALAQRGGDPEPVGPSVHIPRVDFALTTVTLGADQIPSVFGYDAASARALLEGLGLEVLLKENPDVCETPGRALQTEPAVGTRFKVGDPVTLMVSSANPVGFCPGDLGYRFAWHLLDFANGRGPAPDFADSVLVSANGESATITRSDASDPLNWVDGTTLGVLRQQSRAVQSFGGNEFQTPYLRIRPTRADSPSSPCPPAGAVTPTHGGLNMVIEFNTDGYSLGCPTVEVFRTNGQITAIALRTVRLAPQQSETSVEAPSSAGSDPVAEGQRLATTFLQFALGGRAQLPVDTPVNLYLGNELIRVLDAADSADREAWDVCPDSGGGYAEATCPFSAIRTLRGAGDFATSGTLPPDSVCPVEIAPPPTDVGGTVVGSIVIGSTQACLQYAAVIIYANDVGQIVGVNLLLGSP